MLPCDKLCIISLVTTLAVLIGVLHIKAHGLPMFVYDFIKPIFTRLSANELLDKCVHSGTQNANEFFTTQYGTSAHKKSFVVKLL